jgi:hypothetical protein
MKSKFSLVVKSCSSGSNLSSADLNLPPSSAGLLFSPKNGGLCVPPKCSVLSEVHGVTTRRRYSLVMRYSVLDMSEDGQLCNRVYIIFIPQKIFRLLCKKIILRLSRGFYYTRTNRLRFVF